MDGDGRELRIYVKDGDDDFELMMTADIEFFGGVLPMVGDLYSTWRTAVDQSTYRVIARHVVEKPRPKWALIVEELPESVATLNWWTAWINDSTWLDHLPTESDEASERSKERLGEWKKEKLDRNNRDPAYWTEERKQILQKEREARLAAIRAGQEPED